MSNNVGANMAFWGMGIGFGQLWPLSPSLAWMDSVFLGYLDQLEDAYFNWDLNLEG